MQIISSLAEIIDRFEHGQSIVMHSALAEPEVLGAQLAEHAAALAGVRVYSLMSMGAAAYAEPAAAEHLVVETFLPGTGLRRAVNDGRALQHPVRLRDIPRSFAAGERTANYLFLQLSPPDANGDCSLGVSVDYMPVVLAQRPVVVAEFNAQMPRTHGDTSIPLSAIDFAIEVDYPLQNMPSGKADAVDQQVADNVTGLLGNDAVLQYGIGTIPELVLVRAASYQRLSIHAGLITDAVIGAMETGAYDNSGQADHPGSIVTAMAGGSAALYRYLDDNAAVVFKPSTYTHELEVLRRIDKLVAINSVLQIDLSGRANAERAGGRIISGPGGLNDFARGATASAAGISILAIRSCSRRGDQSAIVQDLPDEAATTVTAAHLDYVVTEYGVASVRDKSGGALRRELAAIAHPEFRSQLRTV